MNKLFFEYSSTRPTASRRLRPGFKIGLGLIVLAIIIFAFLKISFQLNPGGYSAFKDGVNKLFKFANVDKALPAQTVLQNSLDYLWITIKVTLTGTTIGFGGALCTSFLASRNITNSLLSPLFKLMVLFLRSFPTIIFVNIARDAFNAEVAAIMIFAWFSWIWCNKYLVEIIANLDTSGYYAYITKGYGRIYAFQKQVLARCKNKFIMVYLYSLESNLRWTTLLATVGVIGIGFFINSNIPRKLEFVGIPLGIILCSIFLIELFNVFVNKVLLTVKSKPNQTFNFKRVGKAAIVFIASVIIFYTLLTINTQPVYFQVFKSKLTSLAYPDLSVWAKDSVLINPWRAILALFYQCIAAVTLAGLYALTVSILLSERLQKPYIWLPAKILNNILKVIPVVILFYIFNPLFISAVGLGVVLFGIHSGTVIARQLSESVNNLEQEIIDFYKLKGYSKAMVIKVYVWPTIKKDFKSFAYIRLEVIFRNMVILGPLGLSAIGNSLAGFERRVKPGYTAAYVWPLMIVIFTYNLLPLMTHALKEGVLWQKLSSIFNRRRFKTKRGR